MFFRQAMVTWHGAVLAIWFWCLLSGAVASDLDVPMVVRPGSPISLEGLEGALITRLRLRADTPDGYLKVRDRESAEIVRTIPLVQIQGKGITSISLAPAETYDIFLASGPAETKVDVFGSVFYHEPSEQLAFALALHPVRTSQDNLPVETDSTVFLLIQGGQDWCSGVVVNKGEGLIATAGHCLAKSGAFQKTRRSGVGDCYDIEAFAGYLDDRGLSPTAACERAAQVMTDQYDYALLKVSWINEGAVTNAPAVGSVPEIMERVYITQHPKGRPMHWCEGRRVDQYAGVDWPDFIVYHDCDTVRGASGAPVFKESGELIAIHVGTRGLTLATTVGDYEYLFTQDRLPKSVAVDVHDVLSLKTKL